jgi:hypothetical protein
MERYRQKLVEWSELTRKLLASGKTEDEAGKEFVEATAAETRGAVSGSEADHYIFNGGLLLSWLGLLRYVKKQKAKSEPAI